MDITVTSYYNIYNILHVTFIWKQLKEGYVLHNMLVF